MDEEREKQVAGALARFLDGDAEAKRETLDDTFPELGPELDALALIDEALEPPEPAPSQLSGHKILYEIGSGGMGRVYLAEDEGLGRKVAIKTLHPRYAGDAALRARFMREARAMARLIHPHVVRIYSLGPASEPPHFVMEHLEGTPLTKAAAPLNFQQKAELMHRVVLAVSFLHEQGIIHRDLKPTNILVGPDLEPKLLDFGLALEAGGHERRLSKPGAIAGTPEYLSPEQARGGEDIGARSDIFSLGTILYELLTAALPFRGENVADLLRNIRDRDPELPRRHDATVPKDLQNICLKALEKDPAQRYASAREMAGDLERYLAGEPVLAAPGAYSRLITERTAQHLSDLEHWWRDQVISDAEFDGLRKRYERLADHEDAWIMEARRLTLPQVSLYLGAWILAVGAALLTLFRYARLTGPPAVLTVCAAAVPTAWIGIRNWRRRHKRVAIAYLLAFCLLLPLAMLVAMGELGWFTGFTQGAERLELFSRLGAAKHTTNAQIWWALLLSLPAYYGLRRFTRASVFSLAFATALALLSLATLLRMGLFDWLDNDPGRFYLHLIPCALLFLAAGFALERRRQADDSRYFYPFAVVFTWAALSGVALFHQPYAHWLGSVAPWTRGQEEYLFILNAGIYFLLDRACDLLSSPQVRVVGKAFRFVIPGHVLTSLWLLGLNASDRWAQSPQDAGMRVEARVLEVLLPALAAVFVFGSIPKQMKNFFATGLLFLAVGVIRLQQDLFKERAAWPVALLVVGLALMLAAANYAPLRMSIRRILRIARISSR